MVLPYRIGQAKTFATELTSKQRKNTLTFVNQIYAMIVPYPFIGQIRDSLVYIVKQLVIAPSNRFKPNDIAVTCVHSLGILT